MRVVVGVGCFVSFELLGCLSAGSCFVGCFRSLCAVDGCYYGLDVGF